MQLLSYSPGHIDTWISNWLPAGGCYFTGFYGHWQTSQRKHSWELLRRIGVHRSLPWSVIGDFNELRYSHESSSARGRAESLIRSFCQTVDDLDLKEIHMQDATFTWSNNRQGAALVRAKLDRGFGNGSFLLQQPRCSITVLPMCSSDHHALSLSLMTGSAASGHQRRRPLRLETW